MRLRTCSSARRSRWSSSGEAQTLDHVERLQHVDLLGEAQVGRIAGGVGERAGVGDRAHERTHAAVVAAQLENLVDDGAVLALQLTRLAGRRRDVGPLLDLDAELAVAPGAGGACDGPVEPAEVPRRAPDRGAGCAPRHRPRPRRAHTRCHGGEPGKPWIRCRRPRGASPACEGIPPCRRAESVGRWSPCWAYCVRSPRCQRVSLALARVVRIHGCVLLRSPPLDVTDIDLEAGNAELATGLRRGPRGLGARSIPAPHRPLLELRGPGGGAAPHGDPPVARDPGGGGRHRLSLPGDLPLHRRAHPAAEPQSQGLPGRPEPGMAGGALGQALGAGPRGHRALQPAQQDRADATGPRRARRAGLDRRACGARRRPHGGTSTSSASRTAT